MKYIRRISDLAFILGWAAGCGSNCVCGSSAWGESYYSGTSVLVGEQEQ